MARAAPPFPSGAVPPAAHGGRVRRASGISSPLREAWPAPLASFPGRVITSPRSSSAGLPGLPGWCGRPTELGTEKSLVGEAGRCPPSARRSFAAALRQVFLLTPLFFPSLSSALLLWLAFPFSHDVAKQMISNEKTVLLFGVLFRTITSMSSVDFLCKLSHAN